MVHHRFLANAEKILQKLTLGDADHRLAVSEPLDRHHDQRPQNRLRREIAAAALAAALRELGQVTVHLIQDLRDQVQRGTDPLVFFPILAYCLGKSFARSDERQYGFAFHTHPCSPSWKF